MQPILEATSAGTVGTRMLAISPGGQQVAGVIIVSATTISFSATMPTHELESNQTRCQNPRHLQLHHDRRQTLFHNVSCRPVPAGRKAASLRLLNFF